MAKLSQPFNAAQVQSLRGVVDFYYWRGIPCARGWPVYKNRPPTPAQAAQRAAYSAACAYIKATQGPMRSIFADQFSAPDMSWVDLLKRNGTLDAKEGPLPAPNYVTGWDASYDMQGRVMSCLLTLWKTPDTAGPSWDLVLMPLELNQDRPRYTLTEYVCARGKKIRPLTVLEKVQLQRQPCPTVPFTRVGNPFYSWGMAAALVPSTATDASLVLSPWTCAANSPPQNFP